MEPGSHFMPGPASLPILTAFVATSSNLHASRTSLASLPRVGVPSASCSPAGSSPLLCNPPSKRFLRWIPQAWLAVAGESNTSYLSSTSLESGYGGEGAFKPGKGFFPMESFAPRRILLALLPRF